jgi:lipopolysaccharide/colanic/teichoic acid biosynthesis glycosyltransferase
MKRTFDVMVSLCTLVVLSPVLAIISVLIFLYDLHSPFYVAPRIGRRSRPFRMVKFRSMVVNADRTGVTSTSATDRRITPVGHIVRRYKLDELVQLWNVLKGDMSLVGPRPNVPSGVSVYTDEERKLLNVRPGITDFASIVFSDEGEILRDHPDPDTAYDQMIRPYKSELGLFYIRVASVRLDLSILWLTALAIVSRPAALAGVSKVLAKCGAPERLVRVATRTVPLVPALPPGAVRV